MNSPAAPRNSWQRGRVSHRSVQRRIGICPPQPQALRARASFDWQRPGRAGLTRANPDAQDSGSDEWRDEDIVSKFADHFANRYIERLVQSNLPSSRRRPGPIPQRAQPSKSRQAARWVPAFAGMTALRGDGPQLLTFCLGRFPHFPIHRFRSNAEESDGKPRRAASRHAAPQANPFEPTIKLKRASSTAARRGWRRGGPATRSRARVRRGSGTGRSPRSARRRAVRAARGSSRGAVS
jgi:hypothetical protein